MKRIIIAALLTLIAIVSLPTQASAGGGFDEYVENINEYDYTYVRLYVADWIITDCDDLAKLKSKISIEAPPLSDYINGCESKSTDVVLIFMGKFSGQVSPLDGALINRVSYSIGYNTSALGLDYIKGSTRYVNEALDISCAVSDEIFSEYGITLDEQILAAVTSDSSEQRGYYELVFEPNQRQIINCSFGVKAEGAEEYSSDLSGLERDDVVDFQITFIDMTIDNEFLRDTDKILVKNVLPYGFEYIHGSVRTTFDDADAEPNVTTINNRDAICSDGVTLSRYFGKSITFKARVSASPNEIVQLLENECVVQLYGKPESAKSFLTKLYIRQGTASDKAIDWLCENWFNVVTSLLSSAALIVSIISLKRTKKAKADSKKKDAKR